MASTTSIIKASDALPQGFFEQVSFNPTFSMDFLDQSSSDVKLSVGGRSNQSDNVEMSPLAAGEEENTRSAHGIKWALICFALYLGALIYGLDTTIAADIQASVVERFDSIELLTWVGTGFPLGSVISIFPYASFYAVFDLKILFVGSIVLFEVGSVICGAAPTMYALIVGRVLAGIGGSGVYMGVLNYFTICTSTQERNRYMAGIGLVWGTGAILGPVVGGAFSSSSATWRWSFYINLVIAAMCAPIYIFYLPSVKAPGSIGSSPLQKLRSLDWFGFVLSAGALTCLATALTCGNTLWPWSDTRTVSVFLAFGFLLVLTVIQQRYLLATNRESRMTPPGRILKDRSQVLLNIETAATVANLAVPLYYIPLYFQFVHGDSAIMAAVRLLPFVLILVTTAMASGFLLPKIGYYWALYTVTGVAMTVGGAMMYTVDIHTKAANIYGYSVLLAFGCGLTFQAGYAVAGIKISQNGWPTADVQRAVSLQNISQIGSTLICLLISGQIFQSLSVRNLSRALSGQGFSDDDIRNAVGGAQSSLFESLSPELAERATQALTEAIQHVYTLSIAAGAISLICALLMKKERLFGLEIGAGGG